MHLRLKWSRVLNNVGFEPGILWSLRPEKPHTLSPIQQGSAHIFRNLYSFQVSYESVKHLWK